MQQKIVKQVNKCYYCEQNFGSFIIYKKRIIVLKRNIDHIIPRSRLRWLSYNPENNYVASCHICNLWKRNHLFDSTEHAKSYLIKQWKKRGFKLNLETEPTWSTDFELLDLKLKHYVLSIMLTHEYDKIRIP
jgi:hypothetical protein